MELRQNNGQFELLAAVAGVDPPARNTPAPAAAQIPSADRVRDYQERLRALEAQALREAQAALAPAPAVPIYEEPQSAPAPDPLVAERKRREYESLFASNVVLSRRPEGQRPDAGEAAATTGPPAVDGTEIPSIDEIADAAVRASARAAGVRPQVAAGAGYSKCGRSTHRGVGGSKNAGAN